MHYDEDKYGRCAAYGDDADRVDNVETQPCVAHVDNDSGNARCTVLHCEYI